MIRRSAFNGPWSPRSSLNKIATGRWWRDRRSPNNMNVDTALQYREDSGHPIRVGMVGAGATGRAIALQLATPVPGIRLVAIANRTIAHGERAIRVAQIANWKRVDSVRDAETAITHGLPVFIYVILLLAA